MNIFVLDEHPILAAQYQCDKHVVKMPLESAQLLCSIFPNGEAPYRRTHYNHPCAVWARESILNYFWLYQHAIALCNEYTFRYGREHKSKAVIEWCINHAKKDLFSKTELTDFIKCMPNEYRVSSVVDSYRQFYKIGKQHILKYTRREQPLWLSSIERRQ